MLDFRSSLMALMPLDLWRIVEFWEFTLVLCGCVWQLVYDAKFDIDGSHVASGLRVGVIMQIVFCLGGIGDSYRATEPHVLFMGFAFGTLIIQSGLIVKSARLCLYRWMGD